MNDDNDRPDRYGEPSEYGGYSGDNRRTPDGRPRPVSTAERARDMRGEGLREARGERPAPFYQRRGH